MPSLSPNVPLSVGEIAKTLGWKTGRARRWLDALAVRDPSIIVRVSGRRMTTLALLRRVCPDVAKRFASDHDVEALRTEQKDQSEEIDELARTISTLRQNSRDSIDALESRLLTLEATDSCRKLSRRRSSL